MNRTQRPSSAVFSQSPILVDSDVTSKLPKVVISVFGSSKVGKTCLIERFVDGRAFRLGEQYPTIEDTYETTIAASDTIKQDVQIIDTAGEGLTEDMRLFYIKKSHGFVLVLNAALQKSFRNVMQWKKEIDKVKGAVIVVANTMGKGMSEGILRDQVEAWASIQRAPLLELNVTDSPVEEVALPFLTLVRKILECNELMEPTVQTGFHPVNSYTRSWNKMKMPPSSLTSPHGVIPTGKVFAFLQGKDKVRPISTLASSNSEKERK